MSRVLDISREILALLTPSHHIPGTRTGARHAWRRRTYSKRANSSFRLRHAIALRLVSVSAVIFVRRARSNTGAPPVQGISPYRRHHLLRRVLRVQEECSVRHILGSRMRHVIPMQKATEHTDRTSGNQCRRQLLDIDIYTIYCTFGPLRTAQKHISYAHQPERKNDSKQ